MSLIFKSKLLKLELKSWIANIALFTLAGFATVIAISRSDKTMLIGIDDVGTRIIASESDRLLKHELKNFLNTFFRNYYSYDEKTFLEQIGRATELMSEDLWNSQKEPLMALNQKLQKTSIVQDMEIEKIDMLDDGKIEAVILIKVRTRVKEDQQRLKVHLAFRKHERSENNPYPYEVTEVTEQRIE